MNTEHFNRHELMEKLTPLIENTAMRFNLIPIEIDFSKENHHWFLRIFLFSYEHEVSIDDCENVSRSLETFLEELIPFKYYLEVSSPGMDRKLKSDKEFELFCGKQIELKLNNSIDNTEDRRIVGKILDFSSNEGLKILKSGTNEELLIPKSNIKSADRKSTRLNSSH